MQLESQMGGGEADPTRSDQIQWTSYNGSLSLTTDMDGVTTIFRRTMYSEHDAALGQEIVSGVYEWTVTAPNGTPNKFVGVATAACNKRTYPSATTAWAMHLYDGDLCSGAAASDSSLGYTRSDGARGYVAARSARKASNGQKNSQWQEWVLETACSPAARGTSVRVILDMDARTLSFAIGDAKPQTAYTNLPRSGVHPYVCSGDKEDNSLMLITSRRKTSGGGAAAPGPAPPASSPPTRGSKLMGG